MLKMDIYYPIFANIYLEGTIRNWNLILSQLAIFFEGWSGRLDKALNLWYNFSADKGYWMVSD